MVYISRMPTVDLFTGEITPQGPPVLTVAELNRNARRLLEQSFPLAWVAGEVSNLTQAASGHLYFSLKDREAQIRCVMFRNRAALLGWTPVNGMQVEVRALVTLYEARGEFQLGVETMRRAGLGALYEAFARLKQKLDAEGLFDAARKRPLPQFPRQVGIVTSLAAAALRDVLTTLARRNPRIPLVIYPSLVQGDGAAQKLAHALAAANRRAECDVLILCRGGGSIEDLWAYNEEVLARAVAASRIPVISGVGHETDFTIADFVADARAPTPTAAAALAVPDRIELLSSLSNLARRLRADLGRLLQARSQRVDQAALRLRHPGARLAEQTRELAQLRRRLARAAPRFGDLRSGVQRRFATLQAATRAGLRMREAQLARVTASLGHLDPDAVLARGYSLVRGADGAVLKDAAQLKSGDAVNIAFARGWADAQITRSGTPHADVMTPNQKP
jgi:exodeoxyribonuclease VII large subunit